MKNFLHKLLSISPDLDHTESVSKVKLKKYKTGFRRNGGIGGTKYLEEQKRIKEIGGFRRLTPSYALKNKMSVDKKYQEKYWKPRFSEEEITKYNKELN